MDMTIDESELEVPAISPVCVFCRRLTVGLIRRCEAFGTDAIPIVIWEGENDHRQSYPGDHGMQFIPWDDQRALPTPEV